MKAERKVFGKLQNTYEPPDLIEIQTKSYHDFLQEDVPPAKRAGQGLQAIFHEIFRTNEKDGGMQSYDGRYVLDFERYELGEPKFTYKEALEEGETYSKPLYVTFKLKDGEVVREDKVFMDEVPMMTDDGAFVINGAERVIVSQLHRSPGISTVAARGLSPFGDPDHQCPEGGLQGTINKGTYEGGFAVWVRRDAQVTINGGEFNVEALIMCDDDHNTVGVTIAGGSFTLTEFMLSSPVKLTITGGTFNKDPAKYVPSTHEVVTEADGTYTVKAK